MWLLLISSRYVRRCCNNSKAGRHSQRCKRRQIWQMYLSYFSQLVLIFSPFRLDEMQQSHFMTHKMDKGWGFPKSNWKCFWSAMGVFRSSLHPPLVLFPCHTFHWPRFLNCIISQPCRKWPTSHARPLRISLSCHFQRKYCKLPVVIFLQDQIL